VIVVIQVDDKKLGGVNGGEMFGEADVRLKSRLVLNCQNLQLIDTRGLESHKNSIAGKERR